MQSNRFDPNVISSFPTRPHTSPRKKRMGKQKSKRKPNAKREETEDLDSGRLRYMNYGDWNRDQELLKHSFGYSPRNTSSISKKPDGETMGDLERHLRRGELPHNLRKTVSPKAKNILDNSLKMSLNDIFVGDGNEGNIMDVGHSPRSRVMGDSGLSAGSGHQKSTAKSPRLDFDHLEPPVLKANGWKADHVSVADLERGLVTESACKEEGAELSPLASIQLKSYFDSEIEGFQVQDILDKDVDELGRSGLVHPNDFLDSYSMLNDNDEGSTGILAASTSLLPARMYSKSPKSPHTPNRSGFNTSLTSSDNLHGICRWFGSASSPLPSERE